MITGLTHPGITVSNLENWLAFIRNVLEANHIQSQVSDQQYLSNVTGLPNAKLKIGFVRFAENSFPLEIIEYTNPPGTRQNPQYGCIGYSHLGFQVYDIQSIYNNCLNYDVNVSDIFIEDHAFWGKYQCIYISAPDGIPIKIIEFIDRELSDSSTQIHHTGITVSDLDGATKLMVENLGLDFVFRGRQNENSCSDDSTLNYEFIVLKVPNHNFMIELKRINNKHCAQIDMGHQHPGCLHHCFQVNDIFNDYDSLKLAGVNFVGAPAKVTAGVNRGAYAIYFIGFDGYRFEIFQKPPQRE